jgi:two-component system cell cycle response regulator CtrA
MKVLIIEDDPHVTKSLELTLREEGHSAESSGSGEDGLQIARLYDFDALIVDLGLPDLGGFQLLRRLREEGRKTPVIVLTGEADVDTTVDCLNAGADDFLTKPYRTRELLARLQAVVRRSQGGADNQIKIGPVVVDLGRKAVFGETESGAQRSLGLTKTEYQIFEILAVNRSRTVGKTYLYDRLYDFAEEEAPTMKVIDVYIHKVRQKLRSVVEGRLQIETVWGQGYRLARQAGESGEGEDFWRGAGVARAGT